MMFFIFIVGLIAAVVAAVAAIETENNVPLVSLFIVGVLMMVGAVVSTIINQDEEASRLVSSCEAQGGIYLENIYRVGKSNHEEVMGCFKKDALIKLDSK